MWTVLQAGGLPILGIPPVTDAAPLLARSALLIPDYSRSHIKEGVLSRSPPTPLSPCPASAPSPRAGSRTTAGHRPVPRCHGWPRGSSRSASTRGRAWLWSPTWPAIPAAFRAVGSADDIGGTYTIKVARPVPGRYVLIWITKLPSADAGRFAAGTFNIVVLGSA